MASDKSTDDERPLDRATKPVPSVYTGLSFCPARTMSGVINPLQRPPERSAAHSNVISRRFTPAPASIRISVFRRDPERAYGLTRPDVGARAPLLPYRHPPHRGTSISVFELRPARRSKSEISSRRFVVLVVETTAVVRAIPVSVVHGCFLRELWVAISWLRFKSREFRD